MKKLMLLLTILVMNVGMVMAQTKTVSGVVISGEDNQPIIGASVRAKGDPTKGSSTNVEGYFQFSIAESETTLVVSYVGMKTQEVKAGKDLKIILRSDSELLDEVIVVAFGKAKKSAFTGSATQINSKDLEKRQVSNVTQALEGKAPGVSVSSGNNQPGTTASVRIRGIGSFSASSSPLYVVDGVPFDGDISSINPQDVKSTTILKDAASAALYGARGANGVILIQTKNGDSSNKSKLNVTIEARYGFNERGVGDYDVIKDPKTYASKYFEGLYNYYRTRKGATPETAYAAAKKTYFSKDPKASNLAYPIFAFPVSGEPFVKQADGSFVMNPEATVGNMYEDAKGNRYWLQPDDWSKEVFSVNPRQEYNVAVSGRSDNSNYYMSVGYLNDQGYITSSSFDRISSRIRGDFRPKEWVKLGGNLGFTHYKSQYLSKTDKGNDSGNIFAVTNFIAPIYPMYVRGEDKQVKIDQWGNEVYDFGNETYPGLIRPYLSLSNPLALYKLDHSDNVADIISARGYVDFNILKGLKATINIGYDSDNTYSTSASNVYYGQFAENGGIIRKTFSRNSSINTQQLLTYIGESGRHHYDFLLGHEFYKSKLEEFYGSKENMYSPDNLEINGAISKPNVGSSSSSYGTEGYLGRAQYDYDNKYFAQFSYRRDASSRFAKENRWGNFWSVGTSWVISRENFMQDLQHVLNMLKVKLSYGMQGNDGIGAFRYMDRYSLKNANDALGVSFAAKGNKNITWETSKNLNVGLEFGLFGDRITGSLDLYSREVTDMLFYRRVARSAGYSGYYDNIGSMRNRGVDFNLAGTIIKTKDIVWSVGINGGYFKNVLTKLPEEWEALEEGYRDGTSVYKVGGSIYDVAYPKYLGVNDEGKPTWQTYDKKTGKYGVTDDHTVAIEKENTVIFTDIAPKLNGGISTNLDIYGFDIAMTFSYALGGRMYDGTYASLMHGGVADSSGHNWHKDILNSWTPENTSTDIPMVNYGGRYANAYSDRFLTSRNYLSLNNITVGYTVPKSFLEKYHLTSSARLYIVADNLALWSARKGFDPRFGGGVGYKAIRTISGGIRFTL